MDHQSYCQKQLYEENAESDDNTCTNNYEEISDSESEFFDVELIKKVKSYPCIYQDRYKKNKDVVSKAWHQISVELNETEDYCQKRWQRLRQYFSKERQQRESGSIKDKRKFALYEEMIFMDPFIIRKKSFKRTKKVKRNSQIAHDEENESSEHFKGNEEEFNVNIINCTPSKQKECESLIDGELESSCNILQGQETNFENQSSESSIVIDDSLRTAVSTPNEVDTICNITSIDNPNNTGNNEVFSEICTERFPSKVQRSQSISSQAQTRTTDSALSLIERDIQNPLVDITLSSINDALLANKKLIQKKNVSKKDEENKAIAELVIKRLQKMEDGQKKKYSNLPNCEHTLFISFINIIYS